MTCERETGTYSFISVSWKLAIIMCAWCRTYVLSLYYQLDLSKLDSESLKLHITRQPNSGMKILSDIWALVYLEIKKCDVWQEESKYLRRKKKRRKKKVKVAVRLMAAEKRRLANSDPLYETSDRSLVEFDFLFIWFYYVNLDVAGLPVRLVWRLDRGACERCWSRSGDAHLFIRASFAAFIFRLGA